MGQHDSTAAINKNEKDAISRFRNDVVQLNLGYILIYVHDASFVPTVGLWSNELNTTSAGTSNLILLFLQDFLPLFTVAATRVPALGLLALLIVCDLLRNRAVPANHALLEVFLLLVSVLVVHERLLDRDGDDVEDVGGLLEDQVHFFQRAVAGLGEEEVNGRKDEGVDHGEDDVGLVFDVLERDRGDHDDHEVEDPVC